MGLLMGLDISLQSEKLGLRGITGVNWLGVAMPPRSNVLAEGRERSVGGVAAM